MAYFGLNNLVLPDYRPKPVKAPASCIVRPQGYSNHHYPARVERTADVEGEALPLYTMSDGRAPWPALADVRRLLGSFSCPVIETGAGLDRLTVGDDFLIDVVSPIATAMAVHVARAADRITPERAVAILRAIGKHYE